MPWRSKTACTSRNHLTASSGGSPHLPAFLHPYGSFIVYGARSGELRKLERNLFAPAQHCGGADCGMREAAQPGSAAACLGVSFNTHAR